jgi:hypothetical protein
MCRDAFIVWSQKRMLAIFQNKKNMIGLKVFQDIKQVKIKRIEIQLFHVIDIVLHLLI